jgi:hypothetical protein
MKKPQILVGVAAMALGLLLGGAFIGRAQAQQPGPRYQYMCLTKISERFWSPEVQGKLNEVGSQGWELLGQRNTMANADVYCFERRY